MDAPRRSRVGLGVFTERVELCGSFPAVDGAMAALDWRMAWEGDSYIASGLLSAIVIASGAGADLVAGKTR